VEQARVDIEVRLDLRATLRPLEGRFLDDGWWRPMRTPDGNATLRLARAGDTLMGTAWGEGADWALARIPDLAGFADDPESFLPEQPNLRDLARRQVGARFGRTRLVFDSMARNVLAQKVTGQEAANGWKALVRRYGEPAPGPDRGLRLPPAPEVIAALPYYEFHPLGIEQRRAETLKRVAAKAPRLEQLAFASSREVRTTMESISGIGEWTSAKTVMVTHGDADAVPVGDFHIKHMAAWHLAGRPRGSDEEMLELLEPYRPHRGRVVRLLHLLGPEPAFGPKVAIRDFSEI
jgi:3-methyladenine DNA glycosylase/8-oxoguanine DNA glycosylase